VLRGGKRPEEGKEVGSISFSSYLSPEYTSTILPLPLSTQRVNRKEIKEGKERKNEGGTSVSNNIVGDEAKKKKCIECGKSLSVLEGYRHPTMGVHCLICRSCFEKVETSVERWGRFVLWNSFNPESPDPTYLDNFPFPHEGTELSSKKPKHHKLMHSLLI